MKPSEFLTLLEKTEYPLLTDGAMGTMIHAQNIGFEQCFDALNLTQPALIAEIHRQYINAGAQIILTNTFGANRYRLAEHGLEDQVAAINRTGVELARRVVLASFKEVLVAGDVGPLGVRLEPFGRVSREEARAAFQEQIQALSDAGVDLLVIETMTDLYELQEAIAAARAVCDLPVVASMTFTRDDLTLLGDPPQKVARQIAEAGADVIGINCSSGPAQILRILRRMRQAVPDGKFWVKPNAGWPEQVAGRIMYPAGPDYLGEYANAFRAGGASLVGGCCGTTPNHIAAMRQALQNPLPEIVLASLPSLAEEDELTHLQHGPTHLAQKISAGHFAVAVEMDPPRGLKTKKVLAGASLLSESGADVINVADSPMARMRMSPWSVCHLIQQEIGIETTLHFPTRGRNLLRVQGDLLAAHALDVRNVFVVMGDPTAIGDYPEAMDDYDLVPSGLIKLIKRGFNVGIDHAGSDIGQPTSFFVGCALNLTPQDFEREAKVLRRKIRNGADFALTQPIFQPEKAVQFLEFYRQNYGELTLPVLVGILPLYGERHAAFLHHEVPGIDIPEEIRQRIRRAGQHAPQEGVRIAGEIITQIHSWAQGVYIMPPFKRYDMAAELCEQIRAF